MDKDSSFPPLHELILRERSQFPEGETTGEGSQLFRAQQIRLKFIKDGLEDQRPNADVQISSLSDFISATRDDKFCFNCEWEN